MALYSALKLFRRSLVALQKGHHDLEKTTSHTHFISHLSIHIHIPIHALYRANSAIQFLGVVQRTNSILINQALGLGLRGRHGGWRGSGKGAEETREEGRDCCGFYR